MTVKELGGPIRSEPETQSADFADVPQANPARKSRAPKHKPQKFGSLQELLKFKAEKERKFEEEVEKLALEKFKANKSTYKPTAPDVAAELANKNGISLLQAAALAIYENSAPKLREDFRKEDEAAKLAAQARTPLDTSADVPAYKENVQDYQEGVQNYQSSESANNGYARASDLNSYPVNDAETESKLAQFTYANDNHSILDTQRASVGRTVRKAQAGLSPFSSQAALSEMAYPSSKTQAETNSDLSASADSLSAVVADLDVASTSDAALDLADAKQPAKRVKPSNMAKMDNLAIRNATPDLDTLNQQVSSNLGEPDSEPNFSRDIQEIPLQTSSNDTESNPTVVVVTKRKSKTVKAQTQALAQKQYMEQVQTLAQDLELSQDQSQSHAYAQSSDAAPVPAYVQAKVSEQIPAQQEIEQAEYNQAEAINTDKPKAKSKAKAKDQDMDDAELLALQTKQIQAFKALMAKASGRASADSTTPSQGAYYQSAQAKTQAIQSSQSTQAAHVKAQGIAEAKAHSQHLKKSAAFTATTATNVIAATDPCPALDQSKAPASQAKASLLNPASAVAPSALAQAQSPVSAKETVLAPAQSLHDDVTDTFSAQKLKAVQKAAHNIAPSAEHSSTPTPNSDKAQAKVANNVTSSQNTDTDKQTRSLASLIMGTKPLLQNYEQDKTSAALNKFKARVNERQNKLNQYKGQLSAADEQLLTQFHDQIKAEDQYQAKYQGQGQTQAPASIQAQAQASTLAHAKAPALARAGAVDKSMVDFSKAQALDQIALNMLNEERKNHIVGLDVYAGKIQGCLDVLNPDNSVTETYKDFTVEPEGLEQLAQWLAQNKVGLVAFNTHNSESWMAVYEFLSLQLPQVTLHVEKWKSLPNQRVPTEPTKAYAQRVAVALRLHELDCLYVPDAESLKIRNKLRRIHDESADPSKIRRAVDVFVNRAHLELWSVFDNYLDPAFGQLVIKAWELRDDRYALEDYIYDNFESDPDKIFKAVDADLDDWHDTIGELSEIYVKWLDHQTNKQQTVDEIKQSLSAYLKRSFECLASIPGFDEFTALTIVSEAGMDCYKSMDGREFVSMATNPNSRSCNEYIRDALFVCARRITVEETKPFYAEYQAYLRKHDPVKSLNLLTSRLAFTCYILLKKCVKFNIKLAGDMKM